MLSNVSGPMSVLVRCDGCGTLRWSLRAKPGAATPGTCEICGSALKLERRRPGRRFGPARRERRDARVPRESPAPRA
jgi:hypothetical protein